ncbi:MAG: hypothetical protein P8Y65_03870 [Campylobacterales bacterium]|jgi:hypothetical protein
MSRKKEVLARYERDGMNRYIIDIASGRTEELYEDFDRQAHYLRRDLDQDLVDYLIACAKELPGKVPLVIRFTFEVPQDDAKYARLRSSVNRFFIYLAELEREAIAQMMRKAGLLFAVGLTIMFAAVWTRQWIGDTSSVVGDVFAEGLTVAAWVSMWEALAVVLIEWLPRRKTVRRLERLASAEVQFRQTGPETSVSKERVSFK